MTQILTKEEENDLAASVADAKQVKLEPSSNIFRSFIIHELGMENEGQAISKFCNDLDSLI